MTTAPSPVDEAKAEALLDTMRSAGAAGDDAKVVALEQLEGGFSRHSYATTLMDGDGGRSDYIVRVRPRSSLLDTDLGAEYRTFVLLVDEDVATPAVHGFEPSSDTPFTGPFFVMDRLPGRAVNVWRGRDRRELAEDWEGPRGIAEDLVRSLATIHGVDAQRAAAAVGARSFTDNVDLWQGVYQETRLVADPVVDEAYAWVRSREPAPVEPALAHGDYRIGNCLIDAGRITGILDWELAFFGDPRFDLGYMSLEYHAGKFTSPGSELFNAVADRAWFFARYTELSGRRVDEEVVATYATLGALMMFAIMTTGLRLYAQSDADDFRMAWNRFVLPGLRQDLVRLMGW